MTQSLYQDHFGIRENPFSIIPDPHYLFMSKRHQDALAHLLYGISESGGFVLLTGEVGTGKTTICRALIEQLPDNVDLSLILNPKLTELELMAAICDEMRIVYPRGTISLKYFFDVLNKHLLAAHARGRNPVLMIDEAQNLSPQVLELVRLLTNLETADKKLLQIILVGQPELNEILAQKEQRQTAQRITARYHLDALTLSECRAYIAHRLKIAGLDHEVFTAASTKAIHKAARGIPRLINSIGDRALLAGYVEGRQRIPRRLARAAAKEVLAAPTATNRASTWKFLGLTLVFVGLLLWVGFDPYRTGIQQTLHAVIQPLLPPAPAPVPVIKSEPKPVPKRVMVKPVQPEPEPKPKPAPKPAPKPDQSGTPDVAFQHLFTRWDLNYLSQPGLTPCDKTKGTGLTCTQGHTDLIGLQAINRPAVVSVASVASVASIASITTDQDQPAYGVINSITASHVTLDLNVKTITLTKDDFVARWPGDYLVLWRNETQIKGVLKLATKSEDVQTLRQLLSTAGYPTQGEETDLFDEDLQQTLRTFQTEHGLQVDGVVGPETLMRITGVAAVTGVDVLYQGAQ